MSSGHTKKITKPIAESTIKEALSACVKCGACQAVCPVYAIIKTEPSVARGKIALIDSLINLELNLSDSLYESLSQCLLCTSCRESCSAGIEIEKIIAEARKIAIDKKGLPPLKKAVLSLLKKNPSIKNPFFRTLKYIQPLFLKKIPSTSGLFYKGTFLHDSEILMPKVAENTFQQLYGKHGRNTLLKKSNVLFFQGCTVNYIYPQIGKATINIIKKAKFSTSILPEQICCGLPAYFSGDIETATSLAKSNIELLANHDFDYLVVACASCGSAFKNIYPILFRGEKNLSGLWEKFKNKVFDISQFISGHAEPETAKLLKKRSIEDVTVTYHDPCHLGKSQAIQTEPRKIIKMIYGIKFIEMEGSTDCCGFGGTFSLENLKLSIEINRLKTEKILKTNTDIVATGCPGCIMQLSSGIIRAGGKQEVRHWVELLDKATEANEL